MRRGFTASLLEAGRERLRRDQERGGGLLGLGQLARPVRRDSGRILPDAGAGVRRGRGQLSQRAGAILAPTLQRQDVVLDDYLRDKVKFMAVAERLGLWCLDEGDHIHVQEIL